MIDKMWALTICRCIALGWHGILMLLLRWSLHLKMIGYQWSRCGIFALPPLLFMSWKTMPGIMLFFQGTWFVYFLKHIYLLLELSDDFYSVGESTLSLSCINGWFLFKVLVIWCSLARSYHNNMKMCSRFFTTYFK